MLAIFSLSSLYRFSNLLLKFCVPYYIFEEIVDYVELTAKGYSKCMKWENIKLLLKLAVIKDKLTNEQAQFLEM